jgi:hypothetical protein
MAHAPDTLDTVAGEPAIGDPEKPPFHVSMVHAMVVEVETMPARSKNKQVNLISVFMAL